MTKEEKIQEAYGEHYHRIRHHVNENGWVDTQTFSLARKGIEFEQYKKRSNTYLGFYNRPKSLQGIENNNGWTKIESGDDLPKIKGNYLVIDKFLETNPSIAFYDPKAVIFLMSSWYEKYSHYQLIINPPEPLY